MIRETLAEVFRLANTDSPPALGVAIGEDADAANRVPCSVWRVNLKLVFSSFGGRAVRGDLFGVHVASLFSSFASPANAVITRLGDVGGGQHSAHSRGSEARHLRLFCLCPKCRLCCLVGLRIPGRARPAVNCD